MNYEIKNENILYEKILNANLFAGLFEQEDIDRLRLR